MKTWKALAAAAFLLLSADVSAVDASIRSSCTSTEEPMISLNDTADGGHVGEPGAYEDQLCVEGATELNVRQSCRSSETEVISLFSLENSHLSEFSAYRYHVCSKGLKADIQDSCSSSNQTEALSVFAEDNSHAASLSVFSKTLCLYREKPQNITVELSGLSGSFYADDNSISTGETLTLVEYPYVVAEDSGATSGIVSYGDFVRLSRPASDTVSLTQQSSSFLLPHFSGGYEELEDEQQQVNSKRFLNLLSPSFTFTIPENPYVRVILQPDQKTEGFTEDLSNQIEIQVRNEGLSGDEVLVSISDEG